MRFRSARRVDLPFVVHSLFPLREHTYVDGGAPGAIVVRNFPRCFRGYFSGIHLPSALDASVREPIRFTDWSRPAQTAYEPPVRLGVRTYWVRIGEAPTASSLDNAAPIIL